MQVVINGESRTFESTLTVLALLELSGLAGKRIAVEINEAIIPKSQHPDTVIANGDRIEIIQAIGGG